MEDVVGARVLPEVTADNAFFWTAGADGVLRIQRCTRCGYYNHPPYPRCARCTAAEVTPAEVSGRGTVHSCTVNHQQWVPGGRPYAIALVELDEQPDVRIYTNIVGGDPSDVAVGDRVEVAFLECGDVWLPQFRKVGP